MVTLSLFDVVEFVLLCCAGSAVGAYVTTSVVIGVFDFLYPGDRR